MTVIHIVLFKFKPEITAEGSLDVLKFISGIKEQLPEIDTVQLGVNFNIERAKGFTHGFAMTFKDKAGLESYDKSKAHVEAVRDYISPKTEDVLIFDYEVEEFSVPPPPAAGLLSES